MKKFLLFALLTCLFAFKHPFYLGVIELKYNMPEKTLQGSVKLFTNDLEEALKKIEGQPVDLIHPKDNAAVKKILEKYLKKRLVIQVNHVPKSFELLGFEQEQEATWLYCELKDCPEPKTISCESSLLYDFIKDQSNIIHVEVKGEKKSLKLNNPERLAEFSFP